jgi:C1A family cysteine protease
MLTPQFKLNRSSPDDRDYVYKQSQVELAPVLDLRKWDSLVEDQGNLGSCVGNAITNTYELMVKHQYPEKFVYLSRLFVYYNARSLEGTLNEDAGTSIRDSLIGLKQYGVCDETLWMYDTSKFNVKPSQRCYKDALPRSIVKYEALYSIVDVAEALSLNMPVVIGMEIYESFMLLTPDNDIVAIPNAQDGPLGGHAVDIVGYDLPKQLFLAKNSYGTNWGNKGYCWIPFEYIKTQVFEKWCFTITDQSIIL